MIIEEKDLLHYGILRKSGRYPWGSGGTVEQRSKGFLEYIDDLKKRLGWGDAEICASISDEHHKFSTKDLRAARTIAKNEVKAADIAMAFGLQNKGYSNVAGAARMGIPESSYRALLKPGADEKANILKVTSDVVRDHVDTQGSLDIGAGVENHLGVSKERLDIAVAMLKEEGYQVHYLDNPQIATGKDTTMKVLVPPGQTHKETFANRYNIGSVSKFSEDGGRTYFGIADPISVSPSRLAIKYKEDGGAVADGVIYVRPGVSDLSIGDARYAQVRVKIGDNHYVKGMAIYSNDIPDGADLLFHTNKTNSGDKFDALKDMRDEKTGKIDPDNPFGSYIRRQLIEKGPDGKERAISAMNIVNEEGNWGGGSINPKTGEPYVGWSKSIASQVLSKQSPVLAKSQLDLTFDRRQKEFDDIKNLTNPTVRKKLLDEFADSTDAASVHLKAASLPRQRWQVIMPVNTLKDTDIYAPNFRDGESVALIRYPHGGTFEIPILTVNNRHSASKKLLGSATDVVGINAKVAERLSGADFDGDTVLVIPNNSKKIRSTPALDQLRNFDPRSEYKAYPGMPRISETRKQKEMGDVSNLITDMTIQQASHAEIARAVRHSMVVIDSAKHNLNYKLSAERNGITALKEKYQAVHGTMGAATLISKAGSTERVPERIARRASEGGPVDRTTGQKVYTPTGRTYVNKKGVTVLNTIRSKKLAETSDAHTLSSGTPMERLYADHSNRLKAMANSARLESVNTPRSTYSPSAARVYEKETAALSAKLDLANRNKPLERQAQTYANALVTQKRQDNPNMDDETLKKIKFQALEEGRRRTGAHKARIEITPKEWEAIQAGAISDSKLTSILTNANMDTVKTLATPRPKLLMSPAKTNQASQMLALGYTRAEVADRLGVSITTLDTAMSGNTGS